MAKQDKRCLYKGRKRDWIKGIISSIFEDAENRITNIGYLKFNNFSTLEYIDKSLKNKIMRLAIP